MPRTKGKTPLSEARILRAAVRYADKHGLDNLSMRTLAGLMDTGTMSIYHYFSSKEELLDAMVEWVAGQIQQPEVEAEWRQAIAVVALSAHEVLMKHAWVNSIWSKRKVGPNKLAYMEALLRVLRQGGFSVSLACDAYHAIMVHIEGFALQAVEFPVKAGDLHAAAANFLDTVESPETIPYFVEHVRHHMERLEGESQFAMMLEMILDGFEQKVAELAR